MARVVAPLLSFAGSGQVGRAITFQDRVGSQRCIAYKVSPDPRTAKQLQMRQVFAWLQKSWQRRNGNLGFTFDIAVDGKPLTSASLWTKTNIRALQSALGLSGLEGAVATNGGIPPKSLTLLPGDNRFTWTLEAPALPVGWLIKQANMITLADQDPHAEFVGPFFGGFDASSPYTQLRTGLLNATTYWVAAYFQYVHPNGRFCTGKSLTGLVTTT